MVRTTPTPSYAQKVELNRQYGRILVGATIAAFVPRVLDFLFPPVRESQIPTDPDRPACEGCHAGTPVPGEPGGLCRDCSRVVVAGFCYNCARVVGPDNANHDPDCYLGNNPPPDATPFL
jgi:hypothetical protein